MFNKLKFTLMKRLFNYSYLVLLCFVAFACSKEEGAVDPTTSLSATSTENVATMLDGYGVGCINYQDQKWSFNIYGPGSGKANAGRGLSHLNLELIDCYGETICLEEGDIINAKIVVGKKTYYAGQLIDGNGFKLEYSDGSCTPGGDVETCIVKFEMIGKMDEILKGSSATFYFTLANGGIISGANVLVKTGNGCFRDRISTCTNYCKPKGETCSYSQGYWFASPVSAGWGSVTVGTTTRTEAEARAIWPATTPEGRAFNQAAALILSGTDISLLPADVQAAYNYIVAYYSGLNNGANLQNAAGTIGDWISMNPCKK
jgi:hypothetical protein